MKKCKIEECEGKFLAKGYCTKHYSRLRANGKTDRPKDKYYADICIVKECDKKYLAMGYCAMHYQRLMKNGNLDDPKSYKFITEYKNLVDEWNYEKNKDININKITYGTKKKVWWKCKACGFEWKCRVSGRAGSKKREGTGCPKCLKSKGENKIIKWMNENNYRHKVQKRFDKCKNSYTLPFDFCVYLGDKFVLVEYDGKQHYESIEYFGGEKAFKKIQHHDSIKNQFCLDNNIPLLRIKYDNKNINNTLKDFLDSQEGINDEGCKT